MVGANGDCPLNADLAWTSARPAARASPDSWTYATEGADAGVTASETVMLPEGESVRFVMEADERWVVDLVSLSESNSANA